MVKELIVERRIEEIREANSDGVHSLLQQPGVRDVAARVYTKLADRWGLSSKEAAKFIGITDRDYRSWRQGDVESLSVIEIEKISCLLGIYQHLATLYSGHMDRVDRWLCRPNHGDLYCGRSPYDLLVGASPNVFYLVRQQLAAETV